MLVSKISTRSLLCSVASYLVVGLGKTCPQCNKLLSVIRSPPNTKHVDVDKAVFQLVPTPGSFEVVWLAFHLHHGEKRGRNRTTKLQAVLRSQQASSTIKSLLALGYFPE